MSKLSDSANPPGFNQQKQEDISDSDNINSDCDDAYCELPCDSQSR